MTRTHRRVPARRLAGLALAVALGLTLAGCGDDDPEQSSDDPTTGSSSSSSPTSEESPSESSSESSSGSSSASESATATVVPASGLELAEETSAVRAPEGWKTADALVDWASAVNGPGSYDSIQLSDRPSLAGDTTIDSLAQSAMQVLPKGSKAERLPDVDLAGSAAYAISYTEPGYPALNDQVATVRNGRSISIDFALDKKTLRKDPQLVESVLATFRWLD